MTINTKYIIYIYRICSLLLNNLEDEKMIEKMLCYKYYALFVILCFKRYAMFVMLCYVMLLCCYAILCYVML